MRVQNTLSCFADFSFEDLGTSEQEYLDYRSKYLDLYEKANSSDKEKASALEDVDFEIRIDAQRYYQCGIYFKPSFDVSRC